MPKRLEQLFDILAACYGQPSFVAFDEVQRTCRTTRGRPSAPRKNLPPRINVPVPVHVLDRLMGQVLAESGADDPEIRSLIFHVLRGLSISEVILGTQPWDTTNAPKFNYLPDHPKLLAEALSLLIEARAGA